jgi:hypothetical protein
MKVVLKAKVATRDDKSERWVVILETKSIDVIHDLLNDSVLKTKLQMDVYPTNESESEA